jgi:hypothetical protein
MSPCYDFQKWTMITLASVAISLSVGPVLENAYGQNDSSSRVDKLIEDTKRENAKNASEKAYRTELTDRIKNSTCTEDLQKLPDLSKDERSNTKLGNASDIFNKNESVILSFLNTTNLEEYLKFCVREGKIK